VTTSERAEVEKRFDRIDRNLAALGTSFAELKRETNTRFDALETKIGDIETEIGQISTHLDFMDAKINALLEHSGMDPHSDDVLGR
jgi:uncharacterized protein Yka (UPF0111/DUF47 family)